MARTACSVRTYDRAAAIIAHAMFTYKGGRDYYTDNKGRRVRKFTVQQPCSADDVKELCYNVRAFDVEDALEIIGANALAYLTKAGYFRDTKKGYFFITKAGAAKYDLPYYLGAKTFID